MKKRHVESELEWMSVRDAAALVVGHLFASELKRHATDRVRHRIIRAAEDRSFTAPEPFGRRYVRRNDFLLWAGEVWPELASKTKLPKRSHMIVPGTGEIGLSGNTPDSHETPSNVDQLRAMYSAERRERRACDVALSVANREIARLERQVEKLERKSRKKV